MVYQTIELYESDTEMGEINRELEGEKLYHADICSVAEGFRMKMQGVFSDLDLARKAMAERMSKPYTVKTLNITPRETRLEFIVRSFIENLDVEPYEISVEEAEEILVAVRPQVFTTPEELASVWNSILPEYMEEE